MNLLEDQEEVLAKRFGQLRLRDLDGVPRSLSELAWRITERTGAKGCSIFLANGPTEMVLAGSSSTHLAKWIGKALYHSGVELTGWVRHLNELLVRNISDQAELSQYADLSWANEVEIDRNALPHEAWVAAPVFVSDRVLGVVRIISSYGGPSPDTLMEGLRFYCRHIGTELIRAGGPPLHPWFIEELYRPTENRLQITDSINDHVIDHLARHPEDMHHLHHRAFEELIAKLLKRDGWHTELTLPTHDGGYDIRAVRSCEDIGEILLLVETKRFRPDRPVGVDVIRALYAVKQIEHATKAMIATTSYVSRDAKVAFFDFMFELDFKEYGDLVAWLRKYSAPDSQK